MRERDRLVNTQGIRPSVQWKWKHWFDNFTYHCEKCHFVWLKCPTFKILVKKRVKQCKDINIKIIKINLGNVDTEVRILMTFFTEMVAIP